MTKPQVQKGVNKHKARHVTRLQWDLFQTGRSFTHLFQKEKNLLNLYATKAESEEISAGLHVCTDISALHLYMFSVFFSPVRLLHRDCPRLTREQSTYKTMYFATCPVKPNPPDAVLWRMEVLFESWKKKKIVSKINTVHVLIKCFHFTVTDYLIYHLYHLV